MKWCESCGKKLFTKRNATLLKKELNDPGLRKYHCSDGLYHLGHLPKDVKKGRRTAREIYPHFNRESNHGKDQRSGV